MGTIAKRWTYEDYLRLDDDERYEIIRVELIETPTPTTTHQRIMGRLFRLMSDFVEERSLGEAFSPGERAIEAFSLKDGDYEVCSFGYEKGKVSSCLLKGLEVNLEKLFKEVL